MSDNSTSYWNAAFSGLGTVGSIGMGIYNAYQSNKALKYQKSLNERMFEREDSAVQRRVKDLQAAGLSPVLAAGSAATSQAGAPVRPPQMEADIGNPIQAYLDASQAKANIANTKAMAKLHDAQAANALEAGVGEKLNNMILAGQFQQMFSHFAEKVLTERGQRANLYEDTRHRQMDNKAKAHDMRYIEEGGGAYDPKSPAGKYYHDFTVFFRNFVNSLRGDIKASKGTGSPVDSAIEGSKGYIPLGNYNQSKRGLREGALW